MERTTAQKREHAKDLLADVFASMAGEEAGPAECRRVGLELVAEALDIAKLDPERVEDMEPVPDLAHAWDCIEGLRERICDLERAVGFAPPRPPLDQRSETLKDAVEKRAGFEPVLSSVPAESLWNELERRGLQLALNGEFQIVAPDGSHPNGQRIVGVTELRPTDLHDERAGLEPAIHADEGFALGATQDAPADGWLDQVRKAIDVGNITEAKRRVAIAVLDRHLTAERALSIINVLRQ